jgi:putative SOS response-associated peptidase YedK
MINARAESVADKPAFRSAFKRQRCLIPANGFYEWKKTGGKKEPYYFRLKDKSMFAFAGLYETWSDAEKKEINSYTMITTKANKLMAPIHDRMPVLLSKEGEEVWLDKEAVVDELLSLLMPFPDAEMECYPVAGLVSAAGNNGPDLIKKLNSE